jgi:DNA polymerase-4
MERAIIHLNVADFAVAVERNLDPRLRQRPLIIAPEGAARATVYDMSEEAYQAGVRKGMPLRRARRRCPDARLVPPHPPLYGQVMRALTRQAKPYSPLIEPGEADGHLFVDVTGTGRLFGPPMDVAWRLRRQAAADLRLTPIWALGPNKLMAKIATRLVKPDGVSVVGAGEEQAFLAPLPLALVPGIEREDLIRLSDFNFSRVGQVANLRREELQIPFGSRAGYLYDAVRGIDPSPVRALGERPPQIVRHHTFEDDAHAPAALEGALYTLVEQAGRTLRDQRLAARRVAVRLGFSDGLVRIRQQGIRPATTNDLVLFAQARSALYRAWYRRVRIRHLGLICDRLTYPPAQQALFPEDRRARRRRTQLVAAMDAIRDRFGPAAIKVGRTLAA